MRTDEDVEAATRLIWAHQPDAGDRCVEETCRRAWPCPTWETAERVLGRPYPQG